MTQRRSQEEWNGIWAFKQFQKGGLRNLNIPGGNQGSAVAQLFKGGAEITGFADTFLQQQSQALEGQPACSGDRLTISREGMDYIRSQLKGLEHAAAEKIEWEVSEEDWHIYTHLDENSVSLKNDFAKYYYERKDNREGYDIVTDSLQYAYTSLRDEIMKGYADGTREVWTQVESADSAENVVEINMNGTLMYCRKVTMEEELAELNDILTESTVHMAENYPKHLEQLYEVAFMSRRCELHSIKEHVRHLREKGFDMPGLDEDFFERIEQSLKRMEEIRIRDLKEWAAVWSQQLLLIKDVLIQSSEQMIERNLAPMTEKQNERQGDTKQGLMQTSVLPQVAESTQGANGRFGQYTTDNRYLNQTTQSFLA